MPPLLPEEARYSQITLLPNNRAFGLVPTVSAHAMNTSLSQSVFRSSTKKTSIILHNTTCHVSKCSSVIPFKVTHHQKFYYSENTWLLIIAHGYYCALPTKRSIMQMHKWSMILSCAMHLHFTSPLLTIYVCNIYGVYVGVRAHKVLPSAGMQQLLSTC